LATIYCALNIKTNKQQQQKKNNEKKPEKKQISTIKNNTK